MRLRGGRPRVPIQEQTRSAVGQRSNAREADNDPFSYRIDAKLDGARMRTGRTPTRGGA